MPAKKNDEMPKGMKVTTKGNRCFNITKTYGNIPYAESLVADFLDITFNCQLFVLGGIESLFDNLNQCGKDYEQYFKEEIVDLLNTAHVELSQRLCLIDIAAGHLDDLRAILKTTNNLRIHSRKHFTSTNDSERVIVIIRNDAL